MPVLIIFELNGCKKCVDFHRINYQKTNFNSLFLNFNQIWILLINSKILWLDCYYLLCYYYIYY